MTPTNEARKFRLWFFRELNDAQRIALLKLFGLPAEEVGLPGMQTHGLRHVLDRLACKSGDATPTNEAPGVDVLAVMDRMCEQASEGPHYGHCEAVAARTAVAALIAREAEQARRIAELEAEGEALRASLNQLHERNDDPELWAGINDARTERSHD